MNEQEPGRRSASPSGGRAAKPASEGGDMISPQELPREEDVQDRRAEERAEDEGMIGKSD